MTPVPIRPRPAKDPTTFYDGLALTLTARRDALTEARNSAASGQPLTWSEMAEWLRFQCWYAEKEAEFMASWLAEAAETDIFPDLCRKLSRNRQHYRLLVAHLAELGIPHDDWAPEPEWDNWVSEFYANGVDILERVIAHNLTGERATIDALERLMPYVPSNTRELIEQLIPDADLHQAMGRGAMTEYAPTLERQARIHAWVMRSFELEQKARLAFDRRIRKIREQAAANDPLEDSRTLGGEVS